MVDVEQIFNLSCHVEYDLFIGHRRTLKHEGGRKGWVLGRHKNRKQEQYKLGISNVYSVS